MHKIAYANVKFSLLAQQCFKLLFTYLSFHNCIMSIKRNSEDKSGDSDDNISVTVKQVTLKKKYITVLSSASSK